MEKEQIIQISRIVLLKCKANEKSKNNVNLEITVLRYKTSRISTI